MTDARLDIREIFGEAIEKTSPEEVREYLDVACAGDADMRAHLEDLLNAHRAAGNFLGGPDLLEVTSVVAADKERPGATIGPYKLLQQIGEGGMGIVYMAEQTQPIRRMVALKIIKPGMDTRQVIARFEAERQALAMMDHPNIARVLDAGTTDSGRPYFVMELVKGVPITQYCDERHLPLRARLELFVPVCQAVQHAHQKGLIHRDIKPSNVLVAEYDNLAAPKVIDFGVAKAISRNLTDRTMFTEFGQVVGTMEYMSPEQAKLNHLDIDTRSDIYSLGVLLYELLTGSTPFGLKRLKEAAFDEMLRIIREEEPQKPSTRLSSSEGLPSIAANRQVEPLRLNRLVRGELDWIVMKCLEKERTRRYETPNGLASDILRHLADEPITAGAPSKRYRLQKFVKRNTGLVLALSSMALLLAVGIVGTTWGLIGERKARQQAVASAAAEKQAKETAQKSESETRAVLEFVHNKILAAARPEGQDGGLGREVTLRGAIEAAEPYVASSFQDQPHIESRLRMTLGVSFWYLGDAVAAVRQFETARALSAKHRGSSHPDTLNCMHNLANVYAELGRDSDALKLREETLKLQRATLGVKDPRTLKGMNNLAHSYEAFGRYAEALKLREETLALMRVQLGPDDLVTLTNMTGLAIDYEEVGRDADALQLREETLTLQKAKLGANHPATLWSMNNLAMSYETFERHAEALALREETLARRKAELGPDHPDTLDSMHNLAFSYAEVGRHKEALQLRKETLALRKSLFGPDHPDTLRSMKALARTYFDLGRYQKALQLGEETLALRKTKLGLDHLDTLKSMEDVAEALVKLDRRAEAIVIIDDCIQRAKGNVDDPEFITRMNELRATAVGTGDD